MDRLSHEYVLNRMLSHSCPASVEDNDIAVFEFDLHCIQIRIRALSLRWNDKMDVAEFEIISAELIGEIEAEQSEED